MFNHSTKGLTQNLYITFAYYLLLLGPHPFSSVAVRSFFWKRLPLMATTKSVKNMPRKKRKTKRKRKTRKTRRRRRSPFNDTSKFVFKTGTLLVQTSAVMAMARATSNVLNP